MATLEVKVLVAELFRSVTMSLPEQEVRRAGFATMYPKDGIKVRVR